jgi:hypothetical protein
MREDHVAGAADRLVVRPQRGDDRIVALERSLRMGVVQSGAVMVSLDQALATRAETPA